MSIIKLALALNGPR